MKETEIQYAGYNVITRVRDNILKSKEQKNHPTYKGWP